MIGWQVVWILERILSKIFVVGSLLSTFLFAILLEKKSAVSAWQNNETVQDDNSKYFCSIFAIFSNYFRKYFELQTRCGLLWISA